MGKGGIRVLDSRSSATKVGHFWGQSWVSRRQPMCSINRESLKFLIQNILKTKMHNVALILYFVILSDCCEWDCLMPQPVHWRVKCNFKSVSLMGLVFCQCNGLKQIQPDDKWSSRQISKIQVLFENTKNSPYSWDILCHIGWIENYMLRLMSWLESSRWNDIGFLPNLNMQTWLDELKTTCCDSCHDKIKTRFHKGHCMVMFCIYKTESRIM